MAAHQQWRSPVLKPVLKHCLEVMQVLGPEQFLMQCRAQTDSSGLRTQESEAVSFLQPHAYPISSAAVEQSTGNVRNWYAVFTSSRHEKSVARHLEQRRLENFLPLYACVRRRANRCRVELELPLFPNYAFVRIGDHERGRVLEVPGVLSIVGSRSMPAPLPEAQIEALRAGIHQRQAEPHPYLIAGERARITRGALAGMEGVLVRRNNGFRVVLSLDQIRQSVAVEVDAFDIEPAGSTRLRRPA